VNDVGSPAAPITEATVEKIVLMLVATQDTKDRPASLTPALRLPEISRIRAPLGQSGGRYALSFFFANTWAIHASRTPLVHLVNLIFHGNQLQSFRGNMRPRNTYRRSSRSLHIPGAGLMHSSYPDRRVTMSEMILMLRCKFDAGLCRAARSNESTSAYAARTASQSSGTAPKPQSLPILDLFLLIFVAGFDSPISIDAFSEAFDFRQRMKSLLDRWVHLLVSI
jgi:hypothetical protein